MAILDSPLLRKVVSFLKRNWHRNTSVDQKRRRLSDLMAVIRSAVEAARARTNLSSSLAAWRDVLDDAIDTPGVAGGRFILEGVARLLRCSPRVSKLCDAIEELESKDGHLDTFPAAVDAHVEADGDHHAVGGVLTAIVELTLLRPPRGSKRKRQDDDLDRSHNGGGPSAAGASSARCLLRA